MFRKYAVYNDDIPMNLKCLVSDHCSVIRYVKNLNDSVKYPILLEYILNSMSVAAVSVEVIMEEHNNLMFRPAFYLCLLVVQVFTMGLISNEVIIQSIMLTDALYESPWYDQNKYIQKLLLTVIIRCQRPLVLTIGPFQPMTLGSALAICKASYSYVSLMIRNYQ
ncbi:odorant receptor Or2-like isoform X2 [Cylas formicarius]|nr:odorant receptor Or2-like isoform X2 [Cylas formicarius]